MASADAAVIDPAPLRALYLAQLVAVTSCAVDNPARIAGDGGTQAHSGSNATASKVSGWWDDAITSWKPLQGTPSECSYRVAAEPSQAAPRLKWKDCPGVAGCRLFEPAGAAGTKLSVVGHVRRAASGYELGVGLAQYPVGTSVVYDSSGTAIWAARADVSKCQPLGPFPGEPLSCLGYTRTSGGQTSTSYACGAATRVRQFADPLSVPQAQLEQFSGELLALWGTAGTATVYDAVHRTTSVLGAPLHVSQAPRVHGAYAFARTQNRAGNYEGYVWSRAAGFRPLLQRFPKQVLDLNGDGRWLVWIEAGNKASSDDAYPIAELWRSPFGVTGGSLAPTKVRTVENVKALVFSISGFGYYALLKDYEGIDLYRTADGKHWKVKPPRGYVADYVLYWVDDEELFYSARTTQRPIAIVRQRLAALGPGD